METDDPLFPRLLWRGLPRNKGGARAMMVVVSSLSPQRRVGLVLVAWCLVFAAALPAASQDDTGDGEVAADELVAGLEADIAQSEQRLEELDAGIVGFDTDVARIGARIRGNDLDRLVLGTEILDLEAEMVDVEEQLVSPVALRRELAVTAYVQGDPRTRAAYSELVSNSPTLETARTRVLVGSVDAWTDTEIDRLRLALETATVERNARQERLATAEAERETALDELFEIGDARLALVEERDELRQQRRTLEQELADAQRDVVLSALAGFEITDGDDPTANNGLGSPKVRPALAVKIDNASRARPQSGLAEADIVYEEIVEGSITRFVAVFQSRDATRVGPVRSARTSDLHILANLNGPLFANSGGNGGTMARVRDSSLIDVGALSNASAFFRLGGRPAPHNLYSSTDALYAADRGRGGLPEPMFAFRAPGAPVAGGVAATRFSVSYGNTTATHTWDEALGGWRRATDGVAHNDAATGNPLAPANVIVQFTEYGTSPADSRSPEAIMAGEGEAWVFTDGQLVQGRWSRPNDEDVTEFTTANGETIAMTPGTTWILLPRRGAVTLG